MSAIQKSLIKFLEIDPPGKDRQAFLAKVMKEVQGLSNDDWDKLSVEEQDWFNEAVDAKNAKKDDDIIDFPDYEAPQEESGSRRRRSSDADASEPKGSSGTREVKESELKVGMPLRIITKRGDDVSGHVIEVGKDFVAIKTGEGKEKEYDLDRIESMTTVASGGNAEPEDPIRVGARVKLISKRGKEVEGEITKLDDKDIFIKDGAGVIHEFDADRVESMTPMGKAQEETSGRRGRSSTKEEKPAEDGKGKNSRASNDGVSVGTRITELVMDNMDASEEKIGELLKKEKLEFRDNTLKLNYAAAHKFIDLAKARKLIK